MKNLKNKGRMGIFGGSFDPVHIGHLRFAELSREIFNLEKIIFIPAYNLPHTYKSNASDYNFRYKITKKSISGNRYFEISDIESKREKKSWTIETLRIMKEIYPEKELYFMMGSDSFEKIDTWKDWRTIISEYKLIIAVRPGMEIKSIYKILNGFGLEYSEFNILKNSQANKEKNINILIANSLIQVSSSQIRELVKQGKSVRYLINDIIYEDIKKYYSEV
jgi:nicotinate-nucleotide adenylyltransferase